MNRAILPLCVVLILTPRGVADQIDFVREVRPIFQKHCYSCHGAKRQKSGFRLDVKAAAFKGGDSFGSAIIPEKPERSPLIQFVRGTDADLKMPPGNKHLPKKEIRTLTKWVEQGANWPDNVDLATINDKRDHWSLKPVQRPDIPEVHDSSWTRNPIDHFVLPRLEKEELKPSPTASRVAWLRRVSFDLTGLPPTPEDVAAFRNDSREDAFERVVDRLLASPRYGERWAQHWLDVVRYADTHGFEVNTERPNAWPYRDYVIEALNRNTPYDQFIREQIVGDALGKDAATGFLITASVLLPGQLGKDAASKRLARQDALDEIVMNVSQTFLGLSVGCARCHDHKFDPISQRDYYSMQAFVAGVEYADRRIPMPDNTMALRDLHQQLAPVQKQLAAFVPAVQSGMERPPINPRENVERFRALKARKARFTILRTNRLEPCVDELEIFDVSGRNVAFDAKVTASGSRVSKNRHELRFVNDGQYGNSRSWMSNEVGKGWVQFEFQREQTIERISWGRDRAGKFADRLALEYRIEIEDSSGKWHTVATQADRRAFNPRVNSEPIDVSKGSPQDQRRARQLLTQKTAIMNRLKSFVDGRHVVFAGKFRKPDEIHLLRRGDPEQPQEKVVPQVLSALGSLKLSEKTVEQDRRKALANWIASREHPLTARVLVNRIWQGHFGTGLVETPNDFGHNGVKPSHPELLDWLASELIRSGWSIKHLHRLIVISATYRQSTRVDPGAAKKDAGVRLLWRYPSRRLDGEMLRDSILQVSGELNLKMGGRGFDLFDKRGGLTGFKPVEAFGEAGLRRLIYAHKVRRERDAVFGAFDCPDGGQSMPRRRESTTPIQALNLLNSRFVMDQSAALADRITQDVGGDVELQIRRAWQLTLNRDPSSEEVNDVLPVVKKHGLIPLCRALFNSNEFLFIP